MNNFQPQNFGEKYVITIFHGFYNQKSVKNLPWFFVTLAVLVVIASVLLGYWSNTYLYLVIVFSLVLFNLLMALIYFERWYFCQIIGRQQVQIDSIKSNTHRFSISLTEGDIASIRSALQLWGKPSQLVENYNDSYLNRHFEEWERFVQKDWHDWDEAEYNHDIGCRYWIQIAIDYCTVPVTRKLLEKIVEPIDEIFKAKMKPCANQQYASKMPQSGQSYFWENNMIYPE